MLLKLMDLLRKRVVILDTIDEAKIEIKNMLIEKKFGEASRKLLD